MNFTKLKFLRERKGVKQEEIAKILAISISRYSHYENGDDTIPIKHLNILCNYFDVSLDYIFTFSSNYKYKKSKTELNTKIIASRIKEFRKDNKLTQEKLAKILNCSAGTIAGYEIGRYFISTDLLYEICSKYNISADYILGKIDNPKYLNNKKN